MFHSLLPQVMINLHVVFTMNPSTEGLKDRAATSPALFNRCVLNWFGDWSTGALYQVGLEFTNKVDLDKSNVSNSECMSLCAVRFLLSLAKSERGGRVGGWVRAMEGSAVGGLMGIKKC